MSFYKLNLLFYSHSSSLYIRLVFIVCNKLYKISVNISIYYCVNILSLYRFHNRDKYKANKTDFAIIELYFAQNVNTDHHQQQHTLVYKTYTSLSNPSTLLYHHQTYTLCTFRDDDALL